MPLPLPDLDQRSYDSLLEEARNLLPAVAPAWTDYNASDPGITLIELLAYLTEIGSYRLNRVTPQQRRAWLRMLGYTVAAAGIAVEVTVKWLLLPTRCTVGSNKGLSATG